MRLITTKEEQLKENYLELHYKVLDDETNVILQRLMSTLKYIEGISNGTKMSIPVVDILYFETVDRKNFAYTQDVCIEVKESLKDIVESYSGIGFIRISKSCIVNAYKIKRLQGSYNMRVIIDMKNGEKLVMNRAYRNQFLKELNQLQGRKQHEIN